MTFIYLCSTGTYASLIGAALHINKLQPNSTIFDIIKLDKFLLKDNTVGKHFFIGEDSQKRLIYTLGVGHEAELVMKSIKDFIRIHNKEVEQISLINLSRFNPRSLLWLKNFSCARNFFAKKMYKDLAEIDKIVNKVKSI